MAGSLRAFSRAALTSLRPASSQLQQQRFAGNLPVHANKYIESWGTAREHIEDTYRWDGKTLRNLAIWAGLFPYFIYKVASSETVKTDKKYGRDPKKLMGC